MLHKFSALFGAIFTLLFWHAGLFPQQRPGNSPAAEKLLQRATAHMQAGDLNSAESELRKALVLAPENVTALSLIGGVLGMQHRLEESSRFFEKALQLDPANPDLRRNLAANQLQLGRTSAAIKNLEILLKSNPADREAILMLGFAWERAQNFPRAITYLEQAPELVRQHPDHIAALVRSYYSTGKKEKARLLLGQLQSSAANPATIYLGGQMALEANDWETAEKLFAAIQATYPRPDLVAYRLAKIRYKSGRYGESKLLLEPIANSPESNGSVLNLLAWCYLKEGEEDTATKILSFAVNKFPEEAANFIDLGKLCLKGNRLDDGLKLVQRGAAKHPGSAPLFELKGELESKQGLHAPAVQSYKQAVQLAPQSQEALLGLAIAQTNLLQPKAAVASFEKGLKLFPGDAPFYAEYGKVLLLPWAAGEIDGAAAKAEQLLLKAVQLDGSHAMARFELGNLLVKSRREEAALPHLEKAASLDPGNAQIHFVLARAYGALGRTEEAERERQLFQKLERDAARRSR